jgi:hypothetical protein
MIGSQMELAPTPNENYTVKCLPRQYPGLASNATNWLLTLAPDLYLYGNSAGSVALHPER